ncbi:MAG: aminopeptidase family protein [Bacteroidetes bacterium]|jgi:Xaa-Pro aminopeptidase|nr:aminopeptidase family protein [Bacteroidota bacterium]MDF2450547.1 aminopeptidase family protein [Bacteroidota bacterium]
MGKDKIKELQEAERKALHLFDVAETRGLIIAGKTEKQLNSELFDLAFELFGIKKYWHKRIVRAGKNTMHPYRENPPDLTIQKDDILFFDFGPVFEDWEADVGRTYVIGNDPLKLKLKSDIEAAWKESRDWFFTKSAITGAEYYDYNVLLAAKYGWTYGGDIAGHLIGNFPHEKIESESRDNYIHPDNHKDMFAPGVSGAKREWILEIHFVNIEKQIGGFHEQFLV